MTHNSTISPRRRGLLQRLRRDERGNVIGIMAASFVPLAAMIGGGLDMSRIYLVKTRLQQACDAGALAGRREMGSSSWSAESYKARTTAERMFDANFADGAYGSYKKAEAGKPSSQKLTRSFTENAGKVTGSASATLPMTLMKIFAQGDKTITVSCDAEMRISNTDVMFVLDVTGSMNCRAGDTSCGNNGNVPASGSKIDGLKEATKCFYEALAKQDTNANCGSTPSGEDLSAVQLRFGFVPYSTMVNVGRLLPHYAIADNWTYQSRVGDFRDLSYSESQPFQAAADNKYNYTYNNWQDYAYYTKVRSYNDCKAYEPDADEGKPSTWSAEYSRSTVTQNGYTYDVWKQNTRIDPAYQFRVIYDSKADTCDVERQRYRYTLERTYARATSYGVWKYQPVSFDVSGLKTMTSGKESYAASISLPLGDRGGSATIAWDGCIEERQTVRDGDGNVWNDWNPIPSAAYDMDIDRLPTTWDSSTQWGPALDDAVWGRYKNDDKNDLTTETVTSSKELNRNFYYACPTEAKKLQKWTTANFQSYVDSLSAIGSTYHDIGLVWGGRLASPTGLFASENAKTPKGGTIERHMIFMTDGDAQSFTTNYTAHGIGWWDRRQTSYTPTDAILTDMINARAVALCQAIKNKGITLWVVSYGGGVNTDTENRLKACASDPGKYKQATSAAQLTAEFKQIAESISALRLTN